MTNERVMGRKDYGDGSYYVGEMINGCEDGKGDQRLIDGTYYSGEWKMGKYNGKGRYHRKEYTYWGEWLDGEYHGQGKKVWHTGTAGEYSGNWDHGKRSGYGVQNFGDGQVYEGQWKDDNIDGWGERTLEDGTVEKGYFRNWVFDPSTAGQENPDRVEQGAPEEVVSEPMPVEMDAKGASHFDSILPIRSKVTAGILAIFLGGLGVHKFYLGQVVQGIIYLLFCWTYIPVILGFIEGIIYLTSSDETFERRNKVRLR